MLVDMWQGFMNEHTMSKRGSLAVVKPSAWDQREMSFFFLIKLNWKRYPSRARRLSMFRHHT